ncbi:MAG: RloB family protein [Cyclobacteriaceae bacterium]|nr:RloB family protein [Cyclobacteriaceae bacterium]
MRKGRRTRKISISFNKRGLILCEGETEENYFKGLVSQEKYRRKFASIDVNIYKPKNHSPIGLVQHAKEQVKLAKRERNEYDFIWVVFDKDGHKGIPDAFEIARTNHPEIKIAYSCPCFEYFVLLHFERTTKHFAKCDDVISSIKKSGAISDYEKSSNLFSLLQSLMHKGLENSEWIAKQFNDEVASGERIYNLPAYSNIHILVNYLYSLV